MNRAISVVSCRHSSDRPFSRSDRESHPGYERLYGEKERSGGAVGLVSHFSRTSIPADACEGVVCKSQAEEEEGSAESAVSEPYLGTS